MSNLAPHSAITSLSVVSYVSMLLTAILLECNYYIFKDNTTLQPAAKLDPIYINTKYKVIKCNIIRVLHITLHMTQHSNLGSRNGEPKFDTMALSN